MARIKIDDINDPGNLTEKDLNQIKGGVSLRGVSPAPAAPLFKRLDEDGLIGPKSNALVADKSMPKLIV